MIRLLQSKKILEINTFPNRPIIITRNLPVYQSSLMRFIYFFIQVLALAICIQQLCCLVKLKFNPKKLFMPFTALMQMMQIQTFKSNRTNTEKLKEEILHKSHTQQQSSICCTPHSQLSLPLTAPCGMFFFSPVCGEIRLSWNRGGRRGVQEGGGGEEVKKRGIRIYS